jgi:hypothetical protein
VFTRAWVAELIDAGDDYPDRAATLVKDGGLKIDFAIAQALVGKRITFCELVSHNIQVNSLGDATAALGKLINQDIFQLIEGVVNRYEVEVIGGSPTPIVSDVRAMRATLVRLFEVRHILVHEFPDNPPYRVGEIASFIATANKFIAAVDQALNTLLIHSFMVTIHLLK